MSIDILFLGGTSIDFIQEKGYKGAIPPLFKAFLGGSITNSAIISSKLGLKIALVSRLGNDLLGGYAISFLNSCKVNTKSIAQDPNIRTPIAIANIDAKGNSKYAFYKNSPKDSIVPIENAPKYILNSCKIFHFGSSFSYQKDSFKETLKYVKFLKKRGAFISYDPNIRPYAIKDKTKVRNRVFKLLKLANIAKLSEIDLWYLTGLKSPKKGLKTLKKGLSCHIVLTLGAKGAMYLDSNGKFIEIPAFKVKIADTIGAGDAFTSGLLYSISKVGEKAFLKNIKRHLIFASAVSAIICTKPGANQALKNLKQVQRFIKNINPENCS